MSQRKSYTGADPEFAKGKGSGVALTPSRQLLTSYTEETLKNAPLSDNLGFPLLQKQFTDFTGAPNYHYTELLEKRFLGNLFKQAEIKKELRSSKRPTA